MNNSGSGGITVDINGTDIIASSIPTFELFTHQPTPILPKTSETVYNRLPACVKCVLRLSEGWLVGSAVRNIFEGKPNLDYDVIVPHYENYMKTCSSLVNSGFDVKINSLGGTKFSKDGIYIDIWPQDLDRFLKNSTKFDYLYNMTKQLLIKNGE